MTYNHHSNYNYFPNTVVHIKVLKLMQLTKYAWLKKNGHVIKVVIKSILKSLVILAI